jgi:hypothetical protein
MWISEVFKLLESFLLCSCHPLDPKLPMKIFTSRSRVFLFSSLNWEENGSVCRVDGVFVKPLETIFVSCDSAGAVEWKKALESICNSSV